METVAYMAAFLAFIWCISLSEKVSKLERKLKDAGIGTEEKSTLKEILEKNKGKLAKFRFESDWYDYEIADKYSLIEDVDEKWLLIKVEKSGIEKLIRIDSIKNVQFRK